MKTNKRFFITPLCLTILSMFAVCDIANAAARTAVRGNVSTARKSVTDTTSKAQDTSTETTEPETQEEETSEPVIIENKSSQFEDSITEIVESSSSNNYFAEQIRKQRASLAASEAKSASESAQQDAFKNNSNACDRDLRKCMTEKCGNGFTKCALDGDTIFGDKLNACKKDTTCKAHEFDLFVKEIKADRDMSVRLASYENVINCGNQYNACIMNECGTTYNKCLGKPYADAAVEKCKTIAKECTESDSGLASRFDTAIGLLRGEAEKQVVKDEKRLYELRDLMSKTCTGLGAMFDERSFDCVFTVNFFAGDNQDVPMASRKRYAGDTFVCMQEWFGVNATTFKENAYRETRAQTAASSAMLGSGVGTAVGTITSGAMGRALDTQKAKKDLKSECEAQGGVFKKGECQSKNSETTETVAETPQSETVAETPQSETGTASNKDAEKTACKAAGGDWIGTTCNCHVPKIWNKKTLKCDEDKNQTRKGMVCTAEYNKTHPGEKVALATYNESGVCTADAGRKKGMVCTDAKAHHLLAKYDDKNDCIVQSCVTGYKVSSKKTQADCPDKTTLKAGTCWCSNGLAVKKDGTCPGNKK